MNRLLFFYENWLVHNFIWERTTIVVSRERETFLEYVLTYKSNVRAPPKYRHFELIDLFNEAFGSCLHLNLFGLIKFNVGKSRKNVNGAQKIFQFIKVSDGLTCGFLLGLNRPVTDKLAMIPEK